MSPPPLDRSAQRGSAAVPVVVLTSVALLLATGQLMIRRAESRINKVALASSPQPVSVVRAVNASFRATRAYGGTFDSWIEADVSPQLLSAYVKSVLVRPGAVVKRGDVLATLDCRDARIETRTAALQARAIAAEQKAVQDEATREGSMLDGGFVSPVDVEQETARSAARQAELEAQKAKLAQASLSVNDCVLRAPFDGEVATRSVDPGAFVHPGTAIVTILDRTTVRFTADAPESDFGMLAAGTPVRVRVYATGKQVSGTIARRSPGTDPETRTVHFEVDVPDANREIPAHTSGEVHIEAGRPVSATEVPLYAASVSSKKATVFVVDGGVVHPRTYDVVGVAAGNLFVDPSLAPGTEVVLEGRELLQDGDHVDPRGAP